MLIIDTPHTVEPQSTKRRRDFFYFVVERYEIIVAKIAMYFGGRVSFEMNDQLIFSSTWQHMIQHGIKIGIVGTYVYSQLINFKELFNLRRQTFLLQKLRQRLK